MHIIGEINLTTYKAFATALRKQEMYSNCVVVGINSPGGSVKYGFLMAELISEAKKRGVQIITIAIAAFSIASFLFMLGDHRVCLGDLGEPIMVHDISFVGTLDEKLNDVKTEAHVAEGEKDRMFAEMSSAANQPRSFFADLINAHNNSNVFLSTRQCLDWGIAHASTVPKFEMEVRIEFKIDGKSYTPNLLHDMRAKRAPIGGPSSLLKVIK